MMFSRFTTTKGALFVQTQHIISIADREAGCWVVWSVNGDTMQQLIEGSAQENFDRLRAEELDLIAAATERQQRVDRGLPLLPIPRGKVGVR